MIFFILGSHPALSAAEILSVLAIKNPETVTIKKEVLFVEETPSLYDLQDRLAGTQKIGHLIGELPLQALEPEHCQELVDFLVSLLSSTQEKQVFGISCHRIDEKGKSGMEKKQVDHIGLLVKKQLKKNGIPARYVSSKSEILSSVIVQTNHLLESGGEFIFFIDKDKFHIGQTQTVQDFAWWSKRDYDRPAFDAKSGMLPPKIARLMINLADPEGKKKILLDPFCGSGTILMEAALLGYETLIGNDLSSKALQDTAKNLTWLFEQKEAHFEKIPSLHLWEGGAEKLLEKAEEESIDVIVTEPYLGPPQKGRETKKEQLAIIKELEYLYKASLKTFFRLLKPNGSVVMVLPIFYKEETGLSLHLLKEIQNMGFRPESLLPASFSKEKTPHGGL